MQTRLTSVHSDQHYQTRVISDLEDRVSALEDKLHRVIGVRRVDAD